MTETTTHPHHRGPAGRRAPRRALLAGLTGLVLLGAGCTGGGGGHPTTTRPVTTAPTTTPSTRPAACRSVDFDEAVVTSRPGPTDKPVYTLTVTGRLPSTRDVARLVPVTYVRQPEYWAIQVQACPAGDVGGPAITPFKVSLDVTGTRGTQGIDVVGATTRQRIDVPAVRPPVLAGTSWVLDPASLGVPVPSGRRITASFTDTTVSGSAACNSYTATYRAEGGRIQLGPIATTKMACEDGANRAEQAYLQTLAAVTGYTVDGDLVLTGTAGRLVYGSPPPQAS